MISLIVANPFHFPATGMNVQRLLQILNQSFPGTAPVPLQESLVTPVSGGSINQAFKIRLVDDRSLFVKVNSAKKFPHLFKLEKEGLEYIASRKVLKTPQIHLLDDSSDEQILVMEWIEEGFRSESFWESFGKQLAELHHQAGKQFGFMHDNYLGSLNQDNSFHSNWIKFFTECRLKPQIELSKKNNRLQSPEILASENLILRLNDIFPEEPASLLHGDLWSGNFLCDKHESVVLIDPAVYYGHRSMDLAMTTLFGGFDKAFYNSYHHYYPFPKNHKEQWQICNLYPLLIHLNLFGPSYLSSIKSILKRFAKG